MTPQRIQRRRTKGWRMPEGAVYVGRPTGWGNPFTVERDVAVPPVKARMWAVRYYGLLLARWDTRELAIIDAVDRFRQHVVRETPILWRWAGEDLAGKDLACWCRLDAPCHADVLLELANAPS